MFLIDVKLQPVSRANYSGRAIHLPAPPRLGLLVEVSQEHLHMSPIRLLDGERSSRAQSLYGAFWVATNDEVSIIAHAVHNLSGWERSEPHVASMAVQFC